MTDLDGLDMRSPWEPLTASAVDALPGCLGVFQLAEPDGTVVRIGYAGGRSLFGLRGELADAAIAAGDGELLFRVEQNMQYLSRWQELLMVHRARHGGLPRDNAPDDAAGLGHLGTRPSGGNR